MYGMLREIILTDYDQNNLSGQAHFAPAWMKLSGNATMLIRRYLGKVHSKPDSRLMTQEKYSLDRRILKEESTCR